MNIGSAAAASTTLTYAVEMKARQAAKAAATERKQDVASGAMEVLSSPRMKASDSAKSQARAKVQAIADRLKILKKLYAYNPKEMAKALAQAFKELKAAVKQFKDAGGAEMSLAGEVATGSDKAATPKDGEDAAASVPSEGAEKTGDDVAPEAVPETACDGASLYGAVVNAARTMIGEDGLDFIKQVRGLANAMSDLLDTARGQAAIRPKNKDTDKQFEATDKELAGLRDDLKSMEQDIHREAPMAGMKLDAAA
jgi:hypothetical protein